MTLKTQPPRAPLSRRRLIQVAGLGGLGAAALAARAQETPRGAHAAHSERVQHAAHVSGAVGRVTSSEVDPTVFLRSFNFSHLPEPERNEAFLLPYTHPWGWATWERAWRRFDYDVPG